MKNLGQIVYDLNALRSKAMSVPTIRQTNEGKAVYVGAQFMGFLGEDDEVFFEQQQKMRPSLAMLKQLGIPYAVN